jgi:uncharacterized protein YpbB
MIVYGFNDTGVARGEMIAARLPGRDLKNFTTEQIAGELGWEHLDTQFVLAKHELIRRMEAEGISQDLIETVRSYKARNIPVVTEIS